VILSPDFLTIRIEQKARHRKSEERLKTASAFRQVDLHPEIAGMLKRFASERKAGFLFRMRNGKPAPRQDAVGLHFQGFEIRL
jgi:hypothetical protein